MTIALNRALLSITRGQPFAATLRVIDENKAAMDVTGWTFTGAFTQSGKTSFVPATFSISGATAGEYDPSLTADATTAMAAGRWLLDVIGTDASGNSNKVMHAITVVN